MSQMIKVIKPAGMKSEVLARHVEEQIVGAYKSLKDLEPFITELWLRFDALKGKETIHGCTTRKEFCDRVLKKSYRAVHYMLTGGNPDNAKQRIGEIQSEIISLPERTPVGAEKSIEWSKTFPSKLKMGDVLFCLRGKTIPVLQTVYRVTSKRIKTLGGDGFSKKDLMAHKAKGNDGFPKNTMVCWNLSAIRVATSTDKKRVHEYEENLKDSPETAKPLTAAVVQREQPSQSEDTGSMPSPSLQTPAPRKERFVPVESKVNPIIVVGKVSELVDAEIKTFTAADKAITIRSIIADLQVKLEAAEREL